MHSLRGGFLLIIFHFTLVWSLFKIHKIWKEITYLLKKVQNWYWSCINELNFRFQAISSHIHPLVFENLLNSGSFFPAQLQHFADHAHKLFWDFVRLTVFALENLIEEIFLIQSLERKRAHCQLVHKYP
jgi:hypothetical protein